MSTDKQFITLGGMRIEVIHKEIKNVHLSVHPPMGRVTISAPQRMDLETIRIYAISRLAWIKSRQNKLRAQKREPLRQHVNRESHYYLGKRYLLKIVEGARYPRVDLKHTTMELHVRENATPRDCERLLQNWYRKQLRQIAPEYIKRWEKKLGVNVNEFGIKKMKTKWGACNPKDKRIWLNLELIKKPLESIDYIILHEIVHLLERKHNDQFVARMDKQLPQWRELKKSLNQSMLGHEEWTH